MRERTCVKKLMLLVCLSSLLMGVGGCNLVRPNPTCSGLFPDHNLENAIRDALGKSPRDVITLADLAQLRYLDASLWPIDSLEGIQNCFYQSDPA